MKSKIQRYVWRPKVPAYIQQAFTPQNQPPFPPGLRFVKADVIFDKQIDWWAPDAPYPYVDPRESRRKKLVGQPLDDVAGPSQDDHQLSCHTRREAKDRRSVGTHLPGVLRSASVAMVK
ncbi:unnamed protein product, partial [Allacma fusca]